MRYIIYLWCLYFCFATNFEFKLPYRVMATQIWCAIFSGLLGLKIIKVYSSQLLSPIEKYRCPPYFNTTDCTEIFSSYRSKYWVPNLAETEVSEVANFNEILEIFVNTHFLLILTNFREVIFPELSYPIILRNEKLAWMWQFEQGNWTLERPTYIPVEVLTRKLKISRTSLIFDVSVNWKNTLPWNNLVSIYTFPHVRLHHIINKFIYLDYHAQETSSMYNIFPSAIPPIKLFILHGSEKFETEQLADLISFITRPRNCTPRFAMFKQPFHCPRVWERIIKFGCKI